MRIEDSKGISNNYIKVQGKKENSKENVANIKETKLINISSQSKKIASNIVEEEEVNEERLNKIKNDILDGTYEISSEKIAEKLIEKMINQKERE